MQDQAAEFEGKVGFCVGTGRCGTTFLTRVIDHEPDVAAWHEREKFGATFHMFCKWHNLPVDSEGFLHSKEIDVRSDLAERSFSFEASALLSHSLEELFGRFRARFLLLVRRPEEVVASFAIRRWYMTPYARKNLDLVPGYQECDHPRHFFGRNVPNGAEFERWNKLTQIGKLAWFWRTRNAAILRQFCRLPAAHCRVERLEDLDFARYLEVANFFGFRASIDAAAFLRLAESRFNASAVPPRHFTDWEPVERAEFEAEVAPLADALGYGYRLDALDSPQAVGCDKGVSLVHVLEKLPVGT